MLAAVQSAGKGQGGRVWLSPRGNLYLSLAIQPRLRHGLALLVAALVCEWLQTQGIVASCKWPNDILYHGKKLGGILCEGAWQGERWRYVIIGIGLNVNVVPLELQAQATSMREISGDEGDVAVYGEQLAHYCTAQLAESLTEDAALARQERFTSAAPELWRRDTEFFLRQPHAWGYLRLMSLRTGKTEELLSSSPAYRLAYQQPARSPLLVADVGNSTLKLVLFKHDKIVREVTSPPRVRDLAAALRALRALLDGEGKWVIYAAVVNHAHCALLREQAVRQDLEVVALHHRPFRVRSAYAVEQLGCDRLAALEAYLATRRHETGLVVNFGTATTIDVVKAGYHEGGYILPGLETARQALCDYTELAPRQLFSTASPACGRTTAAAIARGILHSQVEYIRHLATRLHRPTIVISGGLGRYAMPYLAPAIYEPRLVIEGIRALLLR